MIPEPLSGRNRVISSQPHTAGSADWGHVAFLAISREKEAHVLIPCLPVCSLAGLAGLFASLTPR